MRVFIGALLLSTFVLSSRAEAHGPKGHQNLEVLRRQSDKKFDASMKSFSKGLGVKCSACHVKGAYDRDDLPAKEAAREFMAATIGERDPTKRALALEELLDALELESAKDEARVWRTVGAWKRKPAQRAAHH
jgi:hypothetical protein